MIWSCSGNASHPINCISTYQSSCSYDFDRRPLDSRSWPAKAGIKISSASGRRIIISSWNLKWIKINLNPSSLQLVATGIWCVCNQWPVTICSQTNGCSWLELPIWTQHLSAGKLVKSQFLGSTVFWAILKSVGLWIEFIYFGHLPWSTCQVLHSTTCENSKQNEVTLSVFLLGCHGFVTVMVAIVAESAAVVFLSLCKLIKIDLTTATAEPIKSVGLFCLL